MDVTRRLPSAEEGSRSEIVGFTWLRCLRERNLPGRRRERGKARGRTRTILERRFSASRLRSHLSRSPRSPLRNTTRTLFPSDAYFWTGGYLETLDPYTTEKYTIPSTRCTRLVAVDYAGSMPTATNTSLNVTLARGILAVETYLKGLAPSPLTRLPTYGLMLLDKTNEGNTSGEGLGSWSLKKRDHNRLSVATKYDPQTRVYRSTLLVTWSGVNSIPSSSSGFRPRASSPPCGKQ
jgi:hypothetical protein